MNEKPPNCYICHEPVKEPFAYIRVGKNIIKSTDIRLCGECVVWAFDKLRREYTEHKANGMKFEKRTNIFKGL